MSLGVQIHVRLGDFRLSVAHDFSASGVTSVYGPSGSGKTTLLRAIAGLDRHENSRIEFNGQTWQDESSFVPPHLREIGYVFQEPGLFAHMNVLSNIEFGVKRSGADRGMLDRVVKLLELEPHLTRMPGSLSGGERQRVAIARALAPAPRLLLMDEPLSGLDREMQAEFLPWLDQLHEELEIPVIHVSHSLPEVLHLADELVLLEDGTVSDAGPASELLSDIDRGPARDPDAAIVIEARVESYDDKYGLARLPLGDGTICIADALTPGKAVRIRIAARDVSISLDPPGRSSILNILPATIKDVNPLSESISLARLDVDGQPLLARITKYSAESLELKPGMNVYAQVKSVALL